MTQYTFNLVGLLDLDAHADWIDRGFYENTFVLITRYRQRVQEDFLRSTIEGYSERDPDYIEIALRSLDLRLVMTFHNLDYRLASALVRLVRSLTWEEKFSRVRAAVSVDLTAARYGLRTLDCNSLSSMKTFYDYKMHWPSLMRQGNNYFRDPILPKVVWASTFFWQSSPQSSYLTQTSITKWHP